MIYDIFRLCDRTVWCEDWLDFQIAFEKIIKKFGYDLNLIYYGNKKTAWLKKKEDNGIADKNKKKERAKKPIVYIKGKAQK